MELRLFALAVLIASCHCWPRKHCTEPCGPFPNDCENGVTKDYDGCCAICAKGEGEECGGLWNDYGVCGVDLVCETNGEASSEYDLPRGVCVPARRFSTRNIVKRMLRWM
uniref:Venom toxin n=1 Tax=Hemiscorpius lepturus TaxID=520031 RepID=A0A1L4BJ63_HEMLE|nr:venom toxin [Hemiscorpius lepturus]